MSPAAWAPEGAQKVRLLVRDPLFTVEAQEVSAGARVPLRPGKLQIIGLLAGNGQIVEGQRSIPLSAGQFSLVPASLGQVVLRAETSASLLRVEV